MVFFVEDKVLIKCLRESKRYGAKLSLKCFMINNGTCKPDEVYHGNRLSTPVEMSKLVITGQLRCFRFLEAHEPLIIALSEAKDMPL